MLQVLVIYIQIFLIFVCLLCKVVNFGEIFFFLVVAYIMIVIVHISYGKFILFE